MDAPELARLGTHGVGYRTVTLVDEGAVDVLAIDPASGVAPRRSRPLAIELWYPATVAADAAT